MPETMTTICVTGRDVGTGQGISVTVADGRIAVIEPADLNRMSSPYLAAGLIDLQVNGFRGLDFNDGRLTPARVASSIASFIVSRRIEKSGVNGLSRS